MFNERLGTLGKLKEGIYHEASSQQQQWGNFEYRVTQLSHEKKH